MADVIQRTLRIYTADSSALKPEMLSGKSGVIIEAELPDVSLGHERYVEFVGCVSIPSILDIVGGGGGGGPAGYAFLIRDNDLPTRKRWFMSLTPGEPMGLPSDIVPIPMGVSAVAGVLMAHLELVGNVQSAIEQYGDRLLVIPAMEYKTTAVLEFVEALRGAHGTKR